MVGVVYTFGKRSQSQKEKATNNKSPVKTVRVERHIPAQIVFPYRRSALMVS